MGVVDSNGMIILQNKNDHCRSDSNYSYLTSKLFSVYDILIDQLRIYDAQKDAVLVILLISIRVKHRVNTACPNIVKTNVI